jgi:hypothetical protein
MRRFVLPGFILLFCMLLTTSCRRDQYRVNISAIEAEIGIKRLEKDLFTIDPLFIADSIASLRNDYGEFLQLFSYVINAGDINDSSFADHLVRFCTDKLNYEVYSEVIQTFPDVSSVKAGLERAFSHYLWYFPDARIPDVYTCIAGFNSSIITSDSILGIGLDRYLGSDCKYYRMLEIYGYLAAKMNPRNIVPDCMYAMGATRWDYEEMNYAADNVLSGMIHEGKLKYFEKCMIPDISDTLLFGFTNDQMKFCKNNEGQMWTYLIEQELLFSSDKFVVRKLTGEAPFTSYFTSESPGKAAVWIGFRIIESFMARNRESGLGQMMSETDVQLILNGAKYNPQ